MGKGARSKTKKRLNAAKRAKFMADRGLSELHDLSKRQADPVYSAKCHTLPPTNAFVHPTDPNAVFPKKERQKLLDYRSSAIEEAKVARPVNFRKTERSKYASKVWTAEEMKEEEMDEMTNLMQAKLDTGKEEHLSVEDEDMGNELKQLNIKSEVKDVNMGEIAQRGKGIKKRKRKFKSYKIVNF